MLLICNPLGSDLSTSSQCISSQRVDLSEDCIRTIFFSGRWISVLQYPSCGPVCIFWRWGSAHWSPLWCWLYWEWIRSIPVLSACGRCRWARDIPCSAGLSSAFRTGCRCRTFSQFPECGTHTHLSVFFKEVLVLNLISFYAVPVLLNCGDRTVSTPELTIPHPQVEERAYAKRLLSQIMTES